MQRARSGFDGDPQNHHPGLLGQGVFGGQTCSFVKVMVHVNRALPGEREVDQLKSVAFWADLSLPVTRGEVAGFESLNQLGAVLGD